VKLWDDPHRTSYYFTIDLRNWALHQYGPEFVEFMERRFHPFDPLFALAERAGIVLLNGSGFAAPDWSVRVSLANLDDAAYEQIGRELRAIMSRAGELWKEEQAKQAKARAKTKTKSAARKPA
jgi:aspartate 4-decarboxylase